MRIGLAGMLCTPKGLSILSTEITTKNPVVAIRERKREERLQALRSQAVSLLTTFDACSLWLSGSSCLRSAVIRDVPTVLERQKLRQGHDPDWREIAADSVCMGDRCVHGLQPFLESPCG